MTLCRHLARLMSGDVVLKSRTGVGTTAILTLPRTVLGEAPVDEDDLFDDEEDLLSGFDGQRHVA